MLLTVGIDILKEKCLLIAHLTLLFDGEKKNKKLFIYGVFLKNVRLFIIRKIFLNNINAIQTLLDLLLHWQGF